MVLGKLFNRDRLDDIAHQLYLRLVEQARLPAFYRTGGVPDTVDGRFDMIILHAFLVIRRLGLPPASAKQAKLGQTLFDLMFADMDRNLREMGVGDLSVGAKVRGMAEAFYGRAAAYEAALAETGDDRLIEALARNLYRGADVPAPIMAGMAAYMRQQVAGLSALSSGQLLAGELRFTGPLFAAADSKVFP